MKKILAFSGSNSKNSINQQLIVLSTSLIGADHLEVEVINLRDYEAPIYGIDKEIEDGFPESMKKLKAKFDATDGFMISTPEHNGSMPAVLKNTIDWISRMGGKVFQDKPTVFFSTSPGARGAATALDHLVTIMPYCGAKIVGHYSLGEFGAHVKEGALNPEKEQEIKVIVDRLIDAL